MNLPLLQTALNELTRAHNRLAQVVAALEAQTQTTGPTPADALQDVTATIRKLYPPLPPAPKSVRLSVQSPRRRELEAWIAARSKSFMMLDLPPALRPDGTKATMMLCNMVHKGHLSRVGRGRYQRLLVTQTPAPAAPTAASAPAKPAPPASPVKAAQAVEGAIRSAQASPFSAVAIAIGRGFTGPFTALDLAARLDGKATQAAHYLNAWRARNWIIQSGYGQFKTTPRFGI